MGFVKTFQEIQSNTRTSADFYDAEMLTVFWENKPEIIARLLPAPLKPAAEPVVMAFLANYPRTNFNASTRRARCSFGQIATERKGITALPCWSPMTWLWRADGRSTDSPRRWPT